MRGSRCLPNTPDVLHKSDAGGVQIGLKSAAEVKLAIDTMAESPKFWGARIDGYLLEEMAPAGQELVHCEEQNPPPVGLCHLLCPRNPA